MVLLPAGMLVAAPLAVCKTMVKAIHKPIRQVQRMTVSSAGVHAVYYAVKAAERKAYVPAGSTGSRAFMVQVVQKGSYKAVNRGRKKVIRNAISTTIGLTDVTT
jgi:hypothetical protein